MRKVVLESLLMFLLTILITGSSTMLTLGDLSSLEDTQAILQKVGSTIDFTELNDVNNNSLNVDCHTFFKLSSKKYHMPKQNRFIQIISLQNVSENPYQSDIDLLGEESYWWLAKLVMAETGYVEPEVQMAVCSVVLNRVKCHAFPDSIYEVIMQEGQFYSGPPCFTDSEGIWRPVENEDVNDSVKESIHQVLVNGDTTNGAYFYISTRFLKQSTVDRFHELYGEPCYRLGEDGEFFTYDYGDE